jgi:predicted nucleic acid-binding protein
VIVVDSCGWLEYFADTVYASFYAKAIEDPEHLVVPSICLAEVFKKILKERDEDLAFTAIALMKQGHVVALDDVLALSAGKISAHHSIPMADSIIYATALATDATVLTQDNDLRGLPKVKMIDKK